MITRRELVRALVRRRVADWTVHERAQERATVVTGPEPLRREERRSVLSVVIHHDLTRGRGTARLAVVGSQGDALALVDRLIALAGEAVGPAWDSVPPAAPAKVLVLDPELADPTTTAAAIARSAKTAALAAGATVTATASTLREEVHVEAKSGFRTSWTASEHALHAVVTAGEHGLEVARAARRASALEPERAIASAAADARLLAQAVPVVPGRYQLMLGIDALMHGGGHEAYGVWQVFAAQGDSLLERQGLTRYRLQTPIARGADEVTEPLSITSDGVLELGLRSAPVGEEGDAIRRFPLVERGVCIGFGLSMREAALRRREPNGGVRNLSVARGTWDGLPAARTLEVRRLRALAVDPITGDASLELALAVEHQPGSARPVTGGLVRLDLVAALARARRSATLVARGAYLGPAAVLLDDVEVGPA